jgi:hypothetical protein
LNEAFVIDEATKNRLIEEDSRSAEVIKPFLAGRDVKRYQLPKSDKFLILFPSGFTKNKVGKIDEQQAFQWLQENYTSVSTYLSNFEEKAKARWDKGDYWWELRSCAYMDEFEKPKMMLPDISIRGSYTLDEEGKFYIVNTAYIIGSADKFLLGLLSSQLLHFFYLNLTSSIRGGYLRFIYQYLIQLPIAQADEETKAGIRALVEQVLAAKQADAGADTSALEAEIDLQVYRLYDLTYDEVLLVDPGFAMLREEYETEAEITTVNP